MRFGRLCAAALLATGAVLAPLPASAATTCQDVSYPVRVGLTPLITSQETMAARLCVPDGATTDDSVAALFGALQEACDDL